MARLVVVDDLQRFAQLVAFKLNQEPDIEVVGIGHDGMAAVSMVCESRPDILLTDLEMPLMKGDEAIRLIRRTNTEVKIMVFTRHGDSFHLHGAFHAGANGYVLKGDTFGGGVLDSIVRTVRDAIDGRFSIPESAAPIINDRFREAARLKEQMQIQRELFRVLSKAEFEILERLDRSNPRIALEMCRSTETVKSQVASVLKKLTRLGISSREEAVSHAKRAGLIAARSETRR